MIQLNTDYWSVDFFYEVAQWCIETFAATEHGITWLFDSDYKIHLSEGNLVVFILRWA